MGEELVESSPKTYTERFYEAFPLYMAIGMTSDEFWYGHAMLPKYFRDMFKKKQEFENDRAWLGGLYVFNAVGVAINNAFAKVKKNYPSRPHSLDNAKSEKGGSEDAEEKNYQKMRTMFGAWALARNHELKKREAASLERND